jgi:hypothetical protein
VADRLDHLIDEDVARVGTELLAASPISIKREPASAA